MKNNNPKTKLGISLLNSNYPYDDDNNNIVPNLKLFDHVPFSSKFDKYNNIDQRAQTARSSDSSSLKQQHLKSPKSSSSSTTTQHRQPQRPQSANSTKSGPRGNAVYKVKNCVVPSLTKQQQLQSHNHHNHYINELSEDDVKNIRLEARLDQPKFDSYHTKER
jgi:hypothetical protein